MSSTRTVDVISYTLPKMVNKSYLKVKDKKINNDNDNECRKI